MRRPCIREGCIRVAPPGRTRCTPCQQHHDRARNTERTHYRGDWPKISRAAIAAHRAEHGDWCPGWARPPHPATDLTTDHVAPRTTTAGLRVLCRSCNARKGNHPD